MTGTQPKPRSPQGQHPAEPGPLLRRNRAVILTAVVVGGGSLVCCVLPAVLFGGGLAVVGGALAAEATQWLVVGVIILIAAVMYLFALRLGRRQRARETPESTTAQRAKRPPHRPTKAGRGTGSRTTT